ncbi:hypothetical protein [Acerihabitans arboris]|uniref:Uncharacterized protein n=1 Tax=Acerihabitans arboris TaxID=2691583 RepID=A0A845SMM7_9GAMM|nr:hypothetical protein [Acerihabitans arboris]NDL63871.1 hypothetical protein [Acerihabitans arboris]
MTINAITNSNHEHLNADRSNAAATPGNMGPQIARIGNTPRVQGDIAARRCAGNIDAPGFPFASRRLAHRAPAGLRDMAGTEQQAATFPSPAENTITAAVIQVNPAGSVTRRPYGIGSLLKRENLAKVVKAVGLAMAVATLFSSVALLAGAALGPWLIVVAVGFCVGALACVCAKGLSHYFVRAAFKMTEDKSDKTKEAACALLASTEVLLNGGSESGAGVAGDAGALIGRFGIGGNSYLKAIKISQSAGGAIARVDTLAGGAANRAKQFAAALGTAIGGVVLFRLGGAEKDLGKIGDGAVSGTLFGARVGRFIDAVFFGSFWPQITRNMETRYNGSILDKYLPWQKKEEPSAGPAEAVAAASCAIIVGTAIAINTLPLGSALRDVRNDLNTRLSRGFARTRRTADAARRNLSFGNLVCGVGNRLAPLLLTEGLNYAAASLASR